MSSSSYRDYLRTCLEDGGKFLGLYACRTGITCLVEGGSGSISALSCDTPDKKAPSIVDLAFNANWDEREAHDLYGIEFDGHQPLRPLVNHDSKLDTWTVRLEGEEPYQVAVGPIHAGIIESGHFRFHVVGDRILHLDPRLFYKHRGLEMAAESKHFKEAISYVGRACMACSVSNTLSYALACEDILGLQATNELSRTRTLLLELERIWNHLNDIGAVCAGVGMAAGNAIFGYLVEQVRRICEQVTGHRFMARSIQVGKSEIEVDGSTVEQVRTKLGEIRKLFESSWRDLVFNSTFQDRLTGVGIISQENAKLYGVVGPAGRASGLSRDNRFRDKSLLYRDFEVSMLKDPSGDVKSRFDQRELELNQAFDIVSALLEGDIASATCEVRRGPRTPDEQDCIDSDNSDTGRIGVGLVEGPRGSTLCAVELDGQIIKRVHLRSASFNNWQALAKCTIGNLLPDFPLINKSFELCYACVDR